MFNGSQEEKKQNGEPTKSGTYFDADGIEREVFNPEAKAAKSALKNPSKKNKPKPLGFEYTRERLICPENWTSAYEHRNGRIKQPIKEQVPTDSQEDYNITPTLRRKTITPLETNDLSELSYETIVTRIKQQIPETLKNTSNAILERVGDNWFGKFEGFDSFLSGIVNKSITKLHKATPLDTKLVQNYYLQTIEAAIVTKITALAKKEPKNEITYDYNAELLTSQIKYISERTIIGITAVLSSIRTTLNKQTSEQERNDILQKAENYFPELCSIGPLPTNKLLSTHRQSSLSTTFGDIFYPLDESTLSTENILALNHLLDLTRTGVETKNEQINKTSNPNETFELQPTVYCDSLAKTVRELQAALKSRDLSDNQQQETLQAILTDERMKKSALNLRPIDTLASQCLKIYYRFPKNAPPRIHPSLIKNYLNPEIEKIGTDDQNKDDKILRLQYRCIDIHISCKKLNLNNDKDAFLDYILKDDDIKTTRALNTWINSKLITYWNNRYDTISQQLSPAQESAAGIDSGYQLIPNNEQNSQQFPATDLIVSRIQQQVMKKKNAKPHDLDITRNAALILEDTQTLKTNNCMTQEIRSRLQENAGTFSDPTRFLKPAAKVLLGLTIAVASIALFIYCPFSILTLEIGISMIAKGICAGTGTFGGSVFAAKSAGINFYSRSRDHVCPSVLDSVNDLNLTTFSKLD